jgi:NAD-dependent dihydropyrimidine dehydrogenase PreA subunit
VKEKERGGECEERRSATAGKRLTDREKAGMEIEAQRGTGEADGGNVAIDERVPRTFLRVAVLMALVVILSSISVKMWGGKPETLPKEKVLIVADNMTVAEFGRTNLIADPVLKKVFSLERKEDADRKIAEFNLSREEIFARVQKAAALQEEYQSKNWLKIPIKFGLWILFLEIVFFLMRRGRITPEVRYTLYTFSVILFGVVLGADPSPMGTVKDAIVLFGSKGVIFPPRLAALAIFLAVVFVANKYICAWGCQVGALQDLIFRMNRDPKDQEGVIGRQKLPFAVTNTIRVVFFALFSTAAFLWAFDLIEPVDPFKVYKPATMGIAGVVVMGIIAVTSLFVYRPWCHLFCPFGLVGWLVEKVALFRIHVNYDTCVACRACARSCPSTVMEAILTQDRLIPDCFACGVCINVCPTRSIRFKSGRRAKPPEGKFSETARMSGRAS